VDSSTLNSAGSKRSASRMPGTSLAVEVRE
jgi:hypothetical protein